MHVRDGVRLGLMALLGMVVTSGSAWADRRYYGDTYQVAQAPTDEVELEYWFDYDLPELTRSALPSTVHQIEIETGLADNWDLAGYQVFEGGAGALTWAGMKLESRVRLADPGEWPVNAQLYLEYSHDVEPGNAGVLEGKVILDRNDGALNLAANLIVEKQLSTSEHLELGWDLGASYELSPKLRVGAEYIGRMEKGNVGEGQLGTDFESSHRLAPTVSVAMGKLWWVLAPTFRLGDHGDAFTLRTVMGITL